MKKLLIIVSMTIAASVAAQVSPLDYGLREATSGMGRYFALYNAHVAALQQGTTVNYEGIDTLDIELPPSFKTIPLAPQTDFGGLVIYVTNHAHHGSLFGMSNNWTELPHLDKAMVDSGDYSSVPELAEGDKLLVLNDRTPWTERRGYGYSANRQDLIWIQNGHAQNIPAAPWNTNSTNLQASYTEVDTTLKMFRGLTMHRVKGSTFRTGCLSMNGVCNVLIEDIHVTTPKSKLIADGVFSISKSARVTFRNVTVDGTYSGYGATRNYGYAFSLSTLYDTRFEHVAAWGNWGVFGSNYMNKTELYYCDIDRFDIHCYGRDVYLKGCRLSKRQTSVTSVYGTVRLDSCHFVDYTPVAVRSSYNAYTPFDIELHDCTFELTPRYHAVVCVNLLDTADNPRPELTEKCLPNLTIDGLTVVVPLTVGRLDLFNLDGPRSELQRLWGHIGQVNVKGLRLTRKSGREVHIPVHLSSRPFNTRNEINYSLDDATVLQ